MAISLAAGVTMTAWSSGTSKMRTPRAAAISRAEGVTMLPKGMRSSPTAGISCAVTTRFIDAELRLHCSGRRGAALPKLCDAELGAAAFLRLDDDLDIV